MKRFSIFALAAVAMFVGCTKDIDTDIVKENEIVRGELVEMCVVMEDTRVERDEVSGKLSWSEGDQVAVVLENEGAYSIDTEKYTINFVDGGAKLMIPENTVYAIYPATIAKSVSKSIVTLDLPDTYTVATPEAIFDHNPMRGVIEGDKVIFNNLMGYVKVPLTGNDNLKSLTVKSEIFNGFKPFSRTATLDASDTNAGLVMATTNEARAYVKVKFSTPINLSSSPAVYVPVPANTYGNMALVVETDKGATSIYANNSHKITRSKIKPVSSTAINVTEHTPAAPKSLCGTSGTSGLDYANTYIVPPTAGEYSFKAILADGTSLEGGVTAEIVWAEEAGMFYDFHYDPETNVISFKSNGHEGNALVTLSKHDFDTKTIVWSWLLWCTDQPDVISLKHATNNNLYKIMDRMLGATWAPTEAFADQRTTLGTTETWPVNATVSATDATDGCGIYYQYQNMIPYPRLKNINATSSESSNNHHNTRLAVQYGFHQYCQYWTASTACSTISTDNNEQYRSAASYNLSYMYYYDVQRTDVTGTDENGDDITEVKKSNNAGWVYSSIRGPRSGNLDEGEYCFWKGTSSNKVAISYKTTHDPCPPGYIVDMYGTIYWTLNQAAFNLDSRMGFVRNPADNANFGSGYKLYGMYINGCKNSAGKAIDLYYPVASNRSQTVVNTTGTYGNTGFMYMVHTDAAGETYDYELKKDGKTIKVYHGTSLQYGENGGNALKKAYLNKSKSTNAQAYNVRCMATKEIYD